MTCYMYVIYSRAVFCATGSICQEVENHCEPDPCQNGGRCEGRAGGYMCHCLRHSRHGLLYGGPNCDERLVGCDGRTCHNQGSCIPSLLNGTHGYTCSCSSGYTGPLCATPTTFSFERRGFLLLQSPLVDTGVYCNITLSFRSALPRATLFRRNGRGFALSLELDEGQLRLALMKEDGLSQVLELSQNVSDGEWHSVETVLGKRALSLKLWDDSGSCGRQPCHRAAPVQSTPVSLASPPQNTFIGGALQPTVGPSLAPPVPSFIGCMRDVFVDQRLVIPEELGLGSAVNVSPGCSHRDRCLDVPCKNGGQCVNLWQSYQCRCPRPYEGQDCEEGTTEKIRYADFKTKHFG